MTSKKIIYIYILNTYQNDNLGGGGGSIVGLVFHFIIIYKYIYNMHNENLSRSHLYYF